MTQPVPDPVFVMLCDEESAGRIVVDLEAFVRFSAQLDASLAELETKWALPVPLRSTRRVSPRRRATE